MTLAPRPASSWTTARQSNPPPNHHLDAARLGLGEELAESRAPTQGALDVLEEREARVAASRQQLLQLSLFVLT